MHILLLLSFVVLVYIILCVVIMTFVWCNTLKYHRFKKEDIHIHEKYYMFKRHDQRHWVYWKFLIGAILFWWIKIPLILFSMLLGYIRLKILLGFKSLEEIEQITDQQIRDEIAQIVHYVGLGMRLSFGIFIEEIKPKVDYSQYLGPNYERDEDEIHFTSYITNHTSLIDCAIFADKFSTCFISRSNVRNYPLIGFIGACAGSIFVDRENRSNRGSAKDQLANKQKALHEKKDRINICLFAEGTTSNGLTLLEFMKGGFIQNLPVKPMVIKFEQEDEFSIAMDVIDLIYITLLVFATSYHVVKLYHLPAFQPNDYLYDVYGKSLESKKEKWEIYASAVRSAMAEVSGLKLSQGNYTMKNEYLDFLRNRRKKD